MARSSRRTQRLARRAWRLMPRPLWARAAIVLGVPIAACLLTVNVAVAWLGDTLVFPLSPFHLKAKVAALGQYFQHRPICALTGGHDDLQRVILETAKRRGVDRYLLAALVQVESGSRSHRISPTGAMGAAQLMPGTADLLGVRDPFDPADGIDGGARYLKEMLGRFGGDTRLAVAAYNAGPGAVRGGRVPRNGETEIYVARVMARFVELRPRPPSKRGAPRPLQVAAPVLRASSAFVNAPGVKPPVKPPAGPPGRTAKQPRR